MKYFPVIVLFLAFSLMAEAQNSALKDTSQSGFRNFARQWESDFNLFANRHDTDLVRFIRKHAEGFRVFMDSLKPKQKPEKQPCINPKTGRLDYLEPDSTLRKEYEKQYRVFMDTAPERNSMNVSATVNRLHFYGKTTERELLQVPFKTAGVSEISLKQFCTFYSKDSTLQNNKIELNRIILDMQMDDFGDFLLLRKAVPLIFSENNEQALFASLYLRATLCKDVLIGYDHSGFYCLARFDKTVYNLNVIQIGDKKYHLLLMPGQKSPQNEIGYFDLKDLKPEPQAINLEITGFPRLSDRIVTRAYSFNGNTLKINTNQFLIEYLNDFPLVDLQVYFNTPLSETAMITLDQALIPLLKDKTPEEQVKTLLAFFHQSFIYKNDKDQFGHEKYMFGDESLYYPYTDCEDRAALFSRLVSRYTGLPVIGLDYPRHVSVAVCMPVKNGVPIRFRNKDYYICDPTIRDLKIGAAMPKEYTEKLKIIELQISSQKEKNIFH